MAAAEKPRPKGKIFDITKPGASAPQSTGRPIVVSNRPLIANDPMVTGGEDVTAAANTTDGLLPSAPIRREAKTIQPLNQVDVAAGDSTAEPAPPTGTEEESAAPAISTAPAVLEEPAVADSMAPVLPAATLPVGADITPPKASTGKVESQPAKEAAAEPAKAAADKPAEPVAPDDAEATEPAKDQPASEESDDAYVARTDGKLPQAAAAAGLPTAEADAELERLIEKQTYFVPINAVGRKHSHMVTLLLVLLALLLALVLLDLLLDTHLLRLPGVPHTHFFGAGAKTL